MAFYCKYCGDEYDSLRSLTQGYCNRNSPSNKHVPFEGTKNPDGKYFCKYCGDEYDSLRSLTQGYCNNSPSGKHVPFEGSY